MKKCCMKYGVMVIGLMMVAVFLAGQHILITEVNHDPSSNPELEWVEIHNPTASPYCLDGWYVDDGNYTSLTEGTWWIPNPTAEDDYILYPGGYVTFANNADSFLYKYGYEPDLAENVGSTNAIQIIENAGFNFNADGDQVYLRDNTDSIIDCMQWGTIYEDSTDAIYYPLSVYSGVTYIRNPQDAEGEELEGEVSEQLSEVWSTSNAGFEGPNTGGFNPDGVSGIIISELIHDPTSPSPADTVEIRCKIKTDTTLVFVYMIHSTDTLDTLDNFINPDTSSMSVINDTLYYDTIMPYPLSTRVKYYVSVGNVDGDTVTSPINAPADHREYIVSEGSDFYEVHFNKSVDNASAVQWFAAGNDSMDWHMAKYIGSATKSVDACLYDLDRQIVADSLISAHDKGVAVRFITDADNRTTTQTQQLESAGIPVIDDAFPNSYGGSNI
ncbi:MAG: lamin tail domain-containing protein, partial [candidate division WOR-3 bacterium]|nr:lamin tail domain-containing protein [candidate division WOR-3 bacterium]